MKASALGVLGSIRKYKSDFSLFPRPPLPRKMEVNGGPAPGLAEATLYKGYRPTSSPDHLPHTRNFLHSTRSFTLRPF